MQELFQQKKDSGKFEEFTRALENSKKLSLEEINQLKKIASDQWYGGGVAPGRREQAQHAEAAHATEPSSLEERYALAPSGRQIVPGTQQEQRERAAKLVVFNDSDAKQQLYEQLMIARAATTNDMGGVLDYQADFDIIGDRMRDGQASKRGGGEAAAQEAAAPTSAFS